ncbi:hypothetical protein FRC01_004326 [Tulasnella sp. 417]|nr:hypothetical protein FRC01_004326 [Tulasnella sp. 417]
MNDTGSTVEKFLPFMKMAAPLSERWKLLAFDGEMTDEMVELLQSPAPNLESLLVSSWDNIGVGFVTLELGEGRNIRCLDIDNIAVPWSSTRLRGLRAVQIQRLNGILPSLNELYAMLASSPELWWLQLSNWVSFDDGAALSSESLDIHIRPIAFSFLTTIVLHQIPTAVTQFLLSSIAAPACECAIVQEVPLSLLNNPTSAGTFAGLINSALEVIPTFLLECRKDLGVISILSQPRTIKTYGWIDHVDERPGLDVHLPIEGLSRAQLGSFLSLLNLPDNVELVSDTDGVDWELSKSLLSVGWHRVPKLKVSGSLASRLVCEQLGNLPTSMAYQNRLQSFSSTFDPDIVLSNVIDSIARNIVTYVERTCTRSDKGRQELPSGSSGKPDHEKLEIEMPRILVQTLREPLQNWDIQLSEFEQGSGQEVDNGRSASSWLPSDFESLELNG